MDNISTLEKEVLKFLYGSYQSTKKKVKWPTGDLFKKLGIADGMDVSTLNNSKFVSLTSENGQECFELSSEGIRLMDSLKLAKTGARKSRRPMLDSHTKILWGRAGGKCALCKAELVQDRVSPDPDVVVGIAAHIVADSPNGPRGQSDLPLDQRHLYDNLILLCMRDSKVIDGQLETYTVEKLKELKKKHEAWVSEKLSEPDLVDMQAVPVGQKDIPILDLESIGGSGGPSGHFLTFKITNNSQTQKAIDCQWEVRGFNYSFRAQESDRFSLQPNFSKEVTYRFDTERLYQDEIPELSLVMEYKDINGNTYFTRRELRQVRVPSGAFYTLERGGIFYPAEQTTDLGIKGVSFPDANGDREDAIFEVTLNGKNEFVTIGISGTLLSTWGISNDKEAVKATLAELGSRMVRKMLLKNELKDYLFVTSNFPQEYQNGFEGYKKLRDSL